MKRSHGLLVALGIMIGGVIVVFVALKVYLPKYIEQRVVAEAKARGIDLTPGTIAWGWQWLQLSGATVKLSGAPAFEAKLGLVEVRLANFEPIRAHLSDVQVGVSGSLPRVLFELGQWTRNQPQAFAAPLSASKVSLTVAEAPAQPPWLELSGGVLTRTVAGAAFAAQSCRLSGFELGQVGAGFTKTGSDISIGFGDQSAQAAPLRLDASADAEGAGALRVALTPTKLGLLARGLGMPLPLPNVVASGSAELTFPAGSVLASELRGKLHASLRGFVPPHPPELDGFVFGDTTTFDTDLTLDASRSVVSLTQSKIKAGRFELSGGGSVAREGLDARVDLKLRGTLPCDSLAGAAAQSRLGRLLGRASGKQGKRTASAWVRGEVAVEVEIQGTTADLLNAKLTQKLGVGCGLRPLSLNELVALAPDAQELQAIGNEVGKRLESLGKDLGLPALPQGLKLPTLPILPLAPTPTPARRPATNKQLAAPAPSG